MDNLVFHDLKVIAKELDEIRIQKRNQNLVVKFKSRILRFFHEWSFPGPYPMDK